MAMLTVPVLIFVRIGLRGIRGGKTRYLAGITGRAARTARAVCQPALLDHLHL